MSVELKAIDSIMSGVRSSTSKGKAGMNRLAKTAGKISADKKRKQDAEKKKQVSAAAKKAKEGEKKPESAPTKTKSAPSKSPDKGKTPRVGDVREALGSKKISIEEAIKLNPKGTSTPLSKKPASGTFTPTAKKKKATQPHLPGMSNAKLKQK